MFDENNMTDDAITTAAAAAASTLPCICEPSNTTTTIDAAVELESETTTSVVGGRLNIDWWDGDNLAFYLGLLGVFGSIVAYFIQRNYERYQEKQAEHAQLVDLDRQQALGTH